MVDPSRFPIPRPTAASQAGTLAVCYCAVTVDSTSGPPGHQRSGSFTTDVTDFDETNLRKTMVFPSKQTMGFSG